MSDQRQQSSGYGNLYTPNAGPMVIHMQREGGLANRTIVLTLRQVRLLRLGMLFCAAMLVVGAASWVYLASQAARVPFLTKRIANLQDGVRQLDTLQAALKALELRFQQVQQMLGAAPTGAVQPAAAPRAAQPAAAQPAPIQAVVHAGAPSTNAQPADSALKPAQSAPPPSMPTVLSLIWPVAAKGRIVARGQSGIEIDVPPGTPIRAAAGGVVIDVRPDSATSAVTIRISHSNAYETVYANASGATVRNGERVQEGGVIGSTGGGAQSATPYLRFELRRGGTQVDPSPLFRQGSS